MFKNVNKNLLAIGLGMALSTGVTHGAEFGVFSDVTVGDTSEAGSNPEFKLGGLDFYGTGKIDDKTRVFIEYVFENTSEGLVTDLERLWISRTISDGLTVGVGRFHTPLGSWNRAYHHGAILQDTISRPSFLDFEDGSGAILPTHIVGMLATGGVELGMADLNYEFYVANGPSINTTDSVASNREIEINAQGDPNADKSVGFRSTLSLYSTELAVSVFGMYNTIADSRDVLAGSVGGTLVTQTISGMDLSYVLGRFDTVAEFYVLQNKDEVGALGTQKGGAYYAQFGYQLAEKWKLVYRHEQVQTREGNDAYFSLLGTQDSTQEVVGVRFDLDDTNSLKFEYRYKKPENSNIEPISAYVMQWAFLMP